MYNDEYDMLDSEWDDTRDIEEFERMVARDSRIIEEIWR